MILRRPVRVGLGAGVERANVSSVVWTTDATNVSGE